MAGKVPLHFRIFKGDQLVREERLTLSVIKLGKVPSAHLKLDDETVSRVHAIIEVNGPGDVSIIDLGSTKGTFVNGQKVNKAKLMSGDVILVGESKIELAIGQEEAADGPAASPAAASAPAAAAMPSAPPAPPAPAAFAPAPAPAAFAAPPAPPAFAAAPPTPAFAPAPAAPPVMARPAPAAAPMAAGPSPMAFNNNDFEDVGGARAVEVAAMLGDSVVKVQHCTSNKGGKVSAATWGIFGASAVSLVVAAFSFVSAIRTASYNHAGLAYWTGPKLKKPSWSFRPEMLNLNFDWLALFGIIVGIAGIIYALVRMRRETDGTPVFRIGTAPDVEFPIEGAPTPSFPLVEPRGNEYVLNFAPSMEGEVSIDGQSMSLADAAAQGRARPGAAGGLEMPIGARTKARVRAGQTTFLVSSVAAPKAQPSPLFAGFEALVLLFVGGSAIAHIGMVFLIKFAGSDGAAGGADGDDDEEISMRSSSTSNDDPPPPPPEEKPEEDGNEESGGTGTAMALEEGKMGKKDSTRAEGQYKMAKTQEQEQLARTQAIDQARTAGILGAAVFTQGGAFASITATGDVSSGFDDVNVFGGLLGNEAGEMNGGFGFGRSGFGPGGGGTGWGTIGTGRFGTIGHGSGTGSGYGTGSGRGGGRGHTAVVPTVSIGQPDAQGDLDKSIIRRYIKRNEQKITYCYEKQLLVDKNLAGTVMTQFFISPNGSVASSSGKGVHPEVASCVAGVIKAIAFPAPKGGGGVQVNYPFTFRQSGG